MNNRRHMGIKSAYGQLILLVFLPITILAIVGSVLVFFETQRAIKNEQDVIAQAALIRHAPVIQNLLTKLTSESMTHQKNNQINNAAKTALAESVSEPNQLDESVLLANVLPSKITIKPYNVRSEQNVQRLAVLDGDGMVLASLGMTDNQEWTIDPTAPTIWRKPSVDTRGMIYGIRFNANDRPYWLMVDMDNEPLVIARYRVLLALAITGLVTILLLLLSLNIYSKRWIAPIYEMRLYLQSLSAQKLDKATGFNAEGEFKQLQQDLTRAMRRLKISFDELKKHSDETEADLQQAFDEMEMQNISIRKAHNLALNTSHAKSVFLTNISHELRTPLNSIDGFINLLARRGNLDNKQSMYVETIKKSSAHLLALVNDVLDFSKIEAGKLSLEKHSLNLYDVVYDVADMLSPSAWEKNLRLSLLVYNDVPSHIIGDSLRIKQILTNLIGNAIKFTDTGSVTITVSLSDDPSSDYLMQEESEYFSGDNKDQSLYDDEFKNLITKDQPTKQTNRASDIYLKTKNPNPVIKISIEDTGKGVDKSYQDKLFDSFNQGDLSVTRRYGGTGLGLVISRELVTLMGGEIRLLDNQSHDIAPQGATCWFTLPLIQTQADTDFVAPTLPKGRLLAWLRNSHTMQVLQASLVGTGIEVVSASSFAHLLGQLGELMAASEQWDWVIADGFGEKEDVTALIHQIRLQYQGKLAVFGYHASLDKQMLDSYQAHALNEPLDRRQLYALLGQKNPATTVREPMWHDKTVLIVDDHEPNLLVLEALLQEQGVHVIKAASGFDAIDILSGHLDEDSGEVVDLIFMDIQMPRMSGLQTSLEIRKLEKSKNKTPIPIIALTAHAMHDEWLKLSQSGMDDYAGKPMNQMTLTALLQKWLGNDPTHASSHVLTNQTAQTTNQLPSAVQSDTDIITLISDVQPLPISKQMTAEVPADMPADEYALLDWQDALARVGNKPELAKKLLIMLMADIENQRQALETAWAHRSRSDLASITHRIVGGARYTGVPRLRAIALSFEQQCREDLQAVSPMHFIAMRPNYRKLIDVLDDLQAVDVERYLVHQKDH